MTEESGEKQQVGGMLGKSNGKRRFQPNETNTLKTQTYEPSSIDVDQKKKFIVARQSGLPSPTDAGKGLYIQDFNGAGGTNTSQLCKNNRTSMITTGNFTTQKDLN